MILIDHTRSYLLSVPQVLFSLLFCIAFWVAHLPFHCLSCHSGWSFQTVPFFQLHSLKLRERRASIHLPISLSPLLILALVMAAGNDGALGATFKSVRILQAICFVSIIGLASNFISQIVSSNETAPQVLIGTLSVVSVCVSCIA